MRGICALSVTPYLDVHFVYTQQEGYALMIVVSGM